MGRHLFKKIRLPQVMREVKNLLDNAGDARDVGSILGLGKMQKIN